MQKNIILFMVDEFRADYTGYSGCTNLCTPNIDRIAESVSFSCCQSTNPICAPARTSLATGRYPHQIGTLAMAGDLHPQIPTFMQVLKRAGYYTAASGKLHYLCTWGSNTPRGKILNLVELKEQMKGYGFDDLWEVAGKQLMLRDYCDYSAYLDKKGLYEPYLDFIEEAMEGEVGLDFKDAASQPSILPSEDYIDTMIGQKALEFLKNRPREKPFYLFTSFCSPHMPFDAPKEWLDKVPYEEVDDFVEERPLTLEEKKHLWKKRRAYKAMILLIDYQIGQILDYLEEQDLMKDTVILFTSDHGEMLGDHYRMGKSIPYKEACTVPLAIRHPDWLNEVRCTSPVSLLDVSATILDIAGIDPMELKGERELAFASILPSRSLLPIVKGEQAAIRDYTFTEYGKQWQMLETEEWKYVVWLQSDSPDAHREELYHKPTDREELHNLSGETEQMERLQWFRNRRMYELDHTQAVQTTWAPIHMPER